MVWAARDWLANYTVRGHVLPPEKFPSIRNALQTRQTRAFSEDEHAHGGGEPYAQATVDLLESQGRVGAAALLGMKPSTL